MVGSLVQRATIVSLDLLRLDIERPDLPALAAVGGVEILNHLRAKNEGPKVTFLAEMEKYLSAGDVA